MESRLLACSYILRFSTSKHYSQKKFSTLSFVLNNHLVHHSGLEPRRLTGRKWAEMIPEGILHLKYLGICELGKV